MPNTRAPECRLGDAVAVRDDLARELEPGDVGGRTGRRVVEAGALHQVGAVEPGAVHAHEDLARPGSGSGRSSTSHLLVGDRRALAWRRRYAPAHARAPGPALRCGRAHRRPLGPEVRVADLVVLDADGEDVGFDAAEARGAPRAHRRARGATVSACPRCRSRILAVVALVDLLDDAPPFARSGALLELADDAPTLHLYVRDLGATVHATARGATRARRSGPT